MGRPFLLFLLAKPAKATRREDAEAAYEGLISANVRTPSGPAWEEFQGRVRLAFDDHRFDDVPKLGADEEVIVN